MFMNTALDKDVRVRTDVEGSRYQESCPHMRHLFMVLLRNAMIGKLDLGG